MAVNSIRYTTSNVPGSKFFLDFIQIPKEKRKQVADQILSRYPDRIPILIDKSYNSTLPDIKKHKFLVPRDVTVGKFLCEIRKYISLDETQSVFIFVNSSLLSSSGLLATVYKDHKNDDNFLYITYAGENVFG